ncbi:polysaccharide biosynthesis/export family protein [Antarcticirhabdus aurantiaca]|uniref:Polysaccharide biosynthesis/export family protein n=1 Tax=Antarcticirhabdus aurantiaca TaxID=2606717 RepID=A0ACD4NQX7_9HYPH|nr:polysaccharide biosynthesis/export family protein [Antarcticirhabdus aurantiaca]WAJ29176.1 polysaccharide biosynthesis/export family protein [Jeongeuplla avenae]
MIRLTAVLGLGVALFAASAQAQEYRLQPGDVLNFVVLGANRIDQRIAVDLDGQISVPVGGRFEAAGRTVAELQAEVAEKLKSGSFPIGADQNGRTVWDVIPPEAIVLDIAEYRPIYVSGDILTPGSQPFRSGTSVRQAIAVAGGASPFRTRQDPALELLGSEEQRRALLAQETGIELQIERLNAELKDGGVPAFESVRDNGLDPAQRDELLRNEQELFSTRQRDLDERRATIRQGIETIETRRDLLTESNENLQKETRLYQEELKRVEGLYAKGLVQVGRLNEAQRSVFLVASRSLDVSAELARLDRELVEMRSSLEEATTQRRSESLAQLKAASLELVATRAQIERLSQRLQYFSPRETEPTVEIMRDGGGRSERVAATLDTTLLPGDTVVVRLNDAPTTGLPDDRQAAAAPEPAQTPGAGATAR